VYPVSIYWVKNRLNALYTYLQNKNAEMSILNENRMFINLYLLYSFLNIPDSSTRGGNSNDMEFLYPLKAMLEKASILCRGDQLLMAQFGLTSKDLQTRTKMIGNFKGVAALLDRISGKEDREIMEEFEYGFADFSELWLKNSELIRKLEQFIGLFGYHTTKRIDGLKDRINYICLKILYNVDDRLLPLCVIDEVGKSTAEKLVALGLKDAVEVYTAEDDTIKGIKGIGDRKMLKIKIGAMEYLLKNTMAKQEALNVSESDLEEKLAKYRARLEYIESKEKTKKSGSHTAVKLEAMVHHSE
jgi:hypothetical protein